MHHFVTIYESYYVLSKLISTENAKRESITQKNHSLFHLVSFHNFNAEVSQDPYPGYYSWSEMLEASLIGISIIITLFTDFKDSLF